MDKGVDVVQKEVLVEQGLLEKDSIIQQLTGKKIEKGDTINLHECSFNEIEGYNQLKGSSICLDFLDLYLTDEMIELIVTEQIDMLINI